METSGVELILVVSRYRFPSLVDKLNADLEGDTWARLESNLDDKRVLGWSELDLSSKQKESVSNLDCVRQTAQSHVTRHDLPPFAGRQHNTAARGRSGPMCSSSSKYEVIDMESVHDNLSQVAEFGRSLADDA
jgi:hypothetical protein